MTDIIVYVPRCKGDTNPNDEWAYLKGGYFPDNDGWTSVEKSNLEFITKYNNWEANGTLACLRATPVQIAKLKCDGLI